MEPLFVNMYIAQAKNGNFNFGSNRGHSHCRYCRATFKLQNLAVRQCPPLDR